MLAFLSRALRSRLDRVAKPDYYDPLKLMDRAREAARQAVREQDRRSEQRMKAAWEDANALVFRRLVRELLSGEGAADIPRKLLAFLAGKPLSSVDIDDSTWLYAKIGASIYDEIASSLQFRGVQREALIVLLSEKAQNTQELFRFAAILARASIAMTSLFSGALMAMHDDLLPDDAKDEARLIDGRYRWPESPTIADPTCWNGTAVARSTIDLDERLDDALRAYESPMPNYLCTCGKCRPRSDEEQMEPNGSVTQCPSPDDGCDEGGAGLEDPDGLDKDSDGAQLA